MWKRLAVAVAFVLVGCASAARYQEGVQAWVGHDLIRLLEEWGPPTDTFPSPDGSTLYSWLWVDESSVSGVTIPIGDIWYTTSSSGTKWCQTTFTVSEDVIRHVSWRGNHCKST